MHFFLYFQNVTSKNDIQNWIRVNSKFVHKPVHEIISRVSTSSGNHGKPGKSRKKVPCIEKSWNLKKLNNPGKFMEFCEII